MHAEPIFFTRLDRNTWFFNAAAATAGMNKENMKQIHAIQSLPNSGIEICKLQLNKTTNSKWNKAVFLIV